MKKTLVSECLKDRAREAKSRRRQGLGDLGLQRADTLEEPEDSLIVVVLELNERSLGEAAERDVILVDQPEEPIGRLVVLLLVNEKGYRIPHHVRGDPEVLNLLVSAHAHEELGKA